MIVIEVKLNGELLAIAGADDLAVLSAIVNASGKLGPASRGTRFEESDHNLSLRVGGLTSRGDGVEDEHPVWVDGRRIELGDAVSIRVFETESADVPVRATSAGENIEESNERKWYEMAKDAYLKLRDKYEPDAT